MFTENYTISQQPQAFKKTIDDAIKQQMDIVFFAGYSYDLTNFETVLKEEQDALNYHKHILIVGGDGLYNGLSDPSSGVSNIYTTTYMTIYVPPLTGNGPDLEQYFVAHYQQEFGNSHTSSISSETLYPPHAIEMFDAANAFTTNFQKATSLPSQYAFDQSLLDINFNGLTGLILFNGNQPLGPTMGPSDPLNKDIYMMCTNSSGGLAEVAKYSPGSTPPAQFYLRGQNLLDCSS